MARLVFLQSSMLSLCPQYLIVSYETSQLRLTIFVFFLPIILPRKNFHGKQTIFQKVTWEIQFVHHTDNLLPQDYRMALQTQQLDLDFICYFSVFVKWCCHLTQFTV